MATTLTPIKPTRMDSIDTAVNPADKDSVAETTKKPFKLSTFLKYAVPALMAIGVVAACVFFPPAAIFISPAVEFLAMSVIPSFVGAWSGLVAFAAVVAAAATVAALASALVMKAGSKLVDFVRSRRQETTEKTASQPTTPTAAETTPSSTSHMITNMPSAANVQNVVAQPPVNRATPTAANVTKEPSHTPSATATFSS